MIILKKYFLKNINGAMYMRTKIDERNLLLIEKYICEPTAIELHTLILDLVIHEETKLYVDSYRY